MIDKEKLIAEFKKHGYEMSVIGIIKNFPEEPAIDFDALYKECGQESMGRAFLNFLKSKNITQPQVDMDALRNEIYGEIVKTKEQKTICAVCGETKNAPLRRDDMGGYVCLSCIDAELTKRQKPREIPVKKTWTLKIIYQKLVRFYDHDKEHTFKLRVEPPREILHMYDFHEEIDYSQIPKGSIVEFNYMYCGKEICNAIYRFNSCDSKYVEFSANGYTLAVDRCNINNFRVVEWGKDANT